MFKLSVAIMIADVGCIMRATRDGCRIVNLNCRRLSLVVLA